MFHPQLQKLHINVFTNNVKPILVTVYGETANLKPHLKFFQWNLGFQFEGCVHLCLKFRPVIHPVTIDLFEHFHD
ncbi:unnamed protein product [Acanthoscelides obtectus]|uniref:Uncharacterized protein n=1 Tax=Acanthoscelides obtectus TaxID=200917 RepID=A0A9P0PJT6_ACAOB|nr:unnamed protein product [Acanthoscelides obtectus]CAK1681089.1 hypothetical protein AOBTE_LOCUS33012 [Acanthoscelides obtectus]